MADVITPLISLLTLLASAAILYRERARWTKPTRDLAQLVAGARDGRIPIEEVRQAARGGVRELGTHLADLLHEVRKGQMERAQLDAEMSQRIANRTGALERAMAAMKNQAQRDPMTGLYNRRALDLAFPKVLEQCRASGCELFVMMIDLDRFKHVNDTLGHVVGDHLIGDVGKLIRSSIRENDFAFRYGGDEFAVLLPGVSREAAKALADRLVRLGDELGRTLKIKPAPGLSIGLASLGDHPGADMTELLHAADTILYTHKTARRSA